MTGKCGIRPTPSADNIEQQEEELYALQAILGSDACSVEHEAHACEVYIPSSDARPRLMLRVHMPETYPSASAPIPELYAPYLSQDVLQQAVQDLDANFRPGEVTLYKWVEWLKEQRHLQPPESPSRIPDGGTRPDADLDLKEEAAAEASLDLDNEEGNESGLEVTQRRALWRAVKLEAEKMAAVERTLVHGEHFTERKSTFQGHLAPVHSTEDIEAVMSVLLQSGMVQRATHNIMAFRIFLPDKGTYLQDSDDDGESAAGGRLLHLLQIVDAKNVVVVVSRWYGGIHLGPARFTHINNAARMLLDQCGYISKGTDAKNKKKGR